MGQQKPTRDCLGCGLDIKGTRANETDSNLFHFECFPCDEQWFEDVKHCIPEHYQEYRPH